MVHKWLFTGGLCLPVTLVEITDLHTEKWVASADKKDEERHPLIPFACCIPCWAPRVHLLGHSLSSHHTPYTYTWRSTDHTCCCPSRPQPAAAWFNPPISTACTYSVQRQTKPTAGRALQLCKQARPRPHSPHHSPHSRFFKTIPKWAGLVAVGFEPRQPA